MNALGLYAAGPLPRPLADGRLSDAVWVICPGTGRLLHTEVVDGASPQWDLRPGRA